MKRIGRSLIVVFSYCAVAFHTQADTHYVDLAGSHTTPYTSWATAATNIQVAVNAAVDGDTVHVANGTYLLTSEIVVASDILIESVNGPDVTIVDGSGVTLCFDLEDSACVVSGFTITNGNNSGNLGGGIHCTSTSPVVTNCVISGNTSFWGGGMYYGTANNCTISGNTADIQGGGMQYGTANNCTISGNTADHGGGIRNVVAYNCVISGNSAIDGSGGGIFSGTAFNCTIVGNTALGSFGGGGIYSGTANNCIVWNNTAGTNSNLAGGTQNHTCSLDVVNGVNGNITNAPAFVDELGGNYRLYDTSACIDTGTNGYWVGSTDLDGNARIVNGTVDMGAYEYFQTLDHYVALDGSHTAPYASWATAATNIQTAVDSASGGDTVHVANGTYLLTSEIVVASDILIESVNGPEMTIIQGPGPGGGGPEGISNRCFNLGDSACVVSGLTITNGNTTGDGGGIYCTSTNPVVNNCIITGNKARNGGTGGGMYYGTANNCIVTGNLAVGGIGNGRGGGLRLTTANYCTISGNIAANQGGGLDACTANYCMISENSASSGGGMTSSDANNCIIYGNIATGSMGGGMQFGTAINCTIISNTASTSGGGLRNSTANNCIVWYNIAGADSNSYLGVLNYSCSPDLIHGVDGNITNAPALVGQPGGDYRLASGSPCIDTGTNGFVVGSTDLDGNPRILNGTVDMGAYEFIPKFDHYVALDGSHTAPYTNWAAAATNIQAAVDAAAEGETVHITNGTYLLTAEISVTAGVLIQSVNGPEFTIVDGGGSSRCFNLGSNACVISGFSITNGSSGSGGGIYCSDSTPVVTHCTISGNTASWAGGMYGGTANNCTISGNVATGSGGGGGMRYGTANNCLFSGNAATLAGGGGGMGGGGGGLRDCTANNCTISGNTTDRDGGGMKNSIANNCIVWNNTAGTGGDDISSGTQNHTSSPDAVNGVGGNITNSPAFVDKDNGNYRLAFNSPCIDTGNNGYVVGSEDLDGANRIVETIVDMGAYEYDSILYDTDGDMLSDNDELATGTSPLLSNTDGDAQDDYEEYIADTDGSDSNDWFRVTAINSNSIATPSSAARQYTLEWSTNLVSGEWGADPTQTDVPGNGTTNLFTTPITGADAEYYRVQVKMP